MSPRPAETPASKSGKVTRKRAPLAERLHPRILESALTFAGGDAARVDVISYSRAQVVLGTPKRKRPGNASSS